MSKNKPTELYQCFEDIPFGTKKGQEDRLKEEQKVCLKVSKEVYDISKLKGLSEEEAIDLISDLIRKTRKKAYNDGNSSGRSGMY